MNDWKPHAMEAIKELAPDMIVCDMWSRVGIIAADEIGLPCIVTNVFPWKFVDQFGLMETPSFKNAVSCCGCICMFRTMTAAGSRESTGYFLKDPKAAAAFLANTRRVIISTSFWGFEEC